MTTIQLNNFGKSVQVTDDLVVFKTGMQTLTLSKEEWFAVCTVMNPAVDLMRNGGPCDEDELILRALGDLYIRVAFFENKPYFHIRYYTTFPPSGKLYPTRRGIVLGVYEFTALLREKRNINNLLGDKNSLASLLETLGTEKKRMTYAILVDARVLMREELQRQCSGCQENRPYHLDHICVDWTTERQVNYVYDFVKKNIDKQKAVKLYSEACKNLTGLEADDGRAGALYDQCRGEKQDKMLWRLLAEGYFPKEDDLVYQAVLDALAKKAFGYACNF